MAIKPILADVSISLEDLKDNPLSVIDEELTNGFPVAVISNDEPVFYCISAEKYEMLLDKIDDLELSKLVFERENEPSVKVKIDDL